MTEHPLRRWERVLYLVLLVLALFTRFYALGERAISHDESIHTKFSWNLYSGLGFQHNPMMHGPLLFELTALTYHLLGPNDFTSRVVPALAGVLLVMAPILFRRWLSPAGALTTSMLLLISPSMTYYARYVRHDVLLMLAAVGLLWTIFSFLSSGKKHWLAWMAAFFSIMHATKEASYIYIAIFGGLLAIPLLIWIWHVPWKRLELRTVMLLLLGASMILLMAFGLGLQQASVQEIPLNESGDGRLADVLVPQWARLSAGLAVALAMGAVIALVRGVGESRLRQNRLFSLLVVLGTLTLPLGSAILIKFGTGVDMTLVYDAVRTGNFGLIPGEAVWASAAVVVGTLALSIAVGLWWDRVQWLKIAAIHYAIFLTLYTTVFTWGFGALSGLVGGLAYWLAQQGVKRGNQPSYYYLLIGGLYEYLSLALASVGAFVALRQAIAERWRDKNPQELASGLFPLFLAGWTCLSWVAYTWAGEKMPWLLVHIALPSIFLAGWLLGRFFKGAAGVPWMDGTPWTLAVGLVLGSAASFVVGDSVQDLRVALEGGMSPAGPALVGLRSLGRMLGGMLGLVGAVVALYWSGRRLGRSRSLRVTGTLILLSMSVLTVRTMVMLSFINDDLATEFLVYAHGTPDIKAALQQVRDVSWQTTGTANEIRVAYGEDGSWPFTWYMVEFPNNYFYGTTPDPEQLQKCPVVIAGSAQYTAVENILGQDYIHYDYLYLWWPIQDYFGLTWERVHRALADRAMRGALWDIVWRRDYHRYAQLKNPVNPFTLHTWPYRKDFRLYVRCDVAAQTWPFDWPQQIAAPPERTQETPPPDPYGLSDRALPRLWSVTLPGAALRGLDVAPDGTFYVADTANHRIWHLDPSGVLGGFGAFGTEPGQFNEPWDVAVAADGTLFVADTWNHRIQHLDSEGNVLAAWGGAAQVVQPGVPGAEGLFYGPRGVALSPGGELLVADTGNKRIQIFDPSGRFLREFGGWGQAGGKLDEPVGIAVREDGMIAVADTWNQRVQIFTSEGTAVRQWRIPGWDVTNPDLKPFLSWAGDQLLVTDPLMSRVLAFDDQGAFLWALSAKAGAGFSFPQAIAVAGDALVVTDPHQGIVIAYALP